LLVVLGVLGGGISIWQASIAQRSANAAKQSADAAKTAADLAGKALIESHTTGVDTHTLAEQAKIQAADTAILARAASKQAADTHNVAVDTHALTAANMKAADAAKESAETARDSLIRSRRPWLAIIEPLRVVRPLTFDAGGGSDVELQPSVRNSGTSPAVGTVLYVALVISPISANMDKEVEKVFSCRRTQKDRNRGNGSLILPGDTYEGWRMTVQSLSNDGVRLRFNSDGHTASAWLATCLEYDDEFGNIHSTAQAWYFALDPKSEKQSFLPQGTIDGQFHMMGVATHAF
jgi:hypothetical protein